MTTAMLANLGQEPEVRAFPTDWRGRETRVIEFSWPCGTNDDGHDVEVRLYCYHHKSYKGAFYTASLNNRAQQLEGMWAEAVMSSLRTAQEPCARYSKGAFEKWAWQQLEELRGMADTELVRAYLRGEHAPPR